MIKKIFLCIIFEETVSFQRRANFSLLQLINLLLILKIRRIELAPEILDAVTYHIDLNTVAIK